MHKSTDEKTITVSLTEWNDLQNESRMLNCLYNAGVDCWDGFDFALEEYKEKEESL